jgi:hypothetical protein
MLVPFAWVLKTSLTGENIQVRRFVRYQLGEEM